MESLNLPRPDSTQVRNTTLVEKFAVEIDDESHGFVVSPQHVQRRNVSLWFTDAFLLCLEHLQFFALILSMSLSWPWPLSWIRSTSACLLLNLDFWEFAKVQSVYRGESHAFEDPSTIPFNYFGYVLAWMIAVTLVPLAFVSMCVAISRISQIGPVYTLLLRARTVRAFILIAQAFCIPFGLVVVRLFDCQYYTVPEGGEQLQSTVLHGTKCWSSLHLGILAPLIFFSLLYFFVLPGWMVYRIRMELISPSFCTYRTWRTHEQFVQLKEAEYLLGLDITWAIGHYPLFSSFRRPWVWFHPFSFVAKGTVLVLYGGLFYSLEYQAVAIFSFVTLCWLAVMFIPVYRLYSFNLMLVFSVFINLCNLLLGMLLVLGVENALLIGQNLLNGVIVINTVWLFVALLWLVYLFLRNSKVIDRHRPLWPILSELDPSSKFRSNHTEKFIKAILRCRKLLEQCYSMPEFFAPVHELSRHIQIINAYWREAELLHDPMQSSLWALLAEMVDVHTELTPHSIYGTSSKETLPQTVQELMHLMPALRKRLDQREYDFILWTSRKRRILLKLLVVATFMHIHTPKVRIRIDSGASPRHKGSLSTILQDEMEESNDEFLLNIEKWEQDRRASMDVEVATPKRPSRVSHLSADSVQASDMFIQDVEKWEHARRASMNTHLSVPRKLSRTSYQSSSSIQQNEAFITSVDRWEKDRRASVAARSILLTDRPTRPSSSASKRNVWFNLGTISETEGCHSTSSSNTDVFI